MEKRKWWMGVALLLVGFAAGTRAGDVPDRGRHEIFDMARNGNRQKVRSLLESGLNANIKDEKGCTPLHAAAANGHQLTVEVLLTAGADINAKNNAGRTPLDEAEAHGHSALRRFLLGKGAVRGTASRIPKAGDEAPRLKPSLRFKTLVEFERAIGERAILLDSRHVCFFAPMRKLKEAAVVFPCLVRAYDELYEIVGKHTDYKIAVYAFPKATSYGWGGTSNCSIEYDDTNLDLEKQPEWVKYRVPHVSGYIEEMAHSFVHATKAQFGWEMTGWSLAVEVSRTVADNPILKGQIAKTRKLQRETYERYVRNDYRLPRDVPANKCDRIHAWLLRQSAQKYGAGFWKDFFREIRREAQALKDAVEAGDGDSIRNARYRITIACFDRLPRLDFRETLNKNGISLTTDVKSLRPEDPQWNRRLTE